MNDTHTYLIQLNGQIALAELNAISPLELTAVRADRAATLFSVCADQSGLIGLLRHLHARGLVLLSVTCQSQSTFSGDQNDC
jgi:hypothetical protein